MTAPFLPQAFKAVDGVVLFEGRAVSDMRAIALRHRLMCKALDSRMTQRAADTWWALRTQLIAAINESREQRRASIRQSNTTPTPERAA